MDSGQGVIATAIHVVINNPVNWGQYLTTAIPVVLAFIVALTAYFKSRSNAENILAAQAQADTARDRAESTNVSLGQLKTVVAGMNGTTTPGPKV